MNILITGARGQLGQDCNRVLAARHHLHALSSRQLDISDREQVSRCLEALRPDIVINCAAYTAVDGCETDRENCWRTNGDGPGIVAGACARTGARMIHISTDYVFDGAKPVPEPYQETDPVHPISEYGASKEAGERQVREKLDNHLIVRTSWLYGINGGNFLKTMLRLAVNDPKRTIRVVNDQHGSVTWTYRLARQIEALLDTSLTGTVHATAEGSCTWYEAARHFLQTMQVPCEMEPCTTAEYPTPARRPRNSILENSRLKKEGVNLMVSWQEDVVKFAARYREQLLAEVSGS